MYLKNLLTFMYVNSRSKQAHVLRYGGVRTKRAHVHLEDLQVNYSNTIIQIVAKKKKKVTPSIV